MVSSFVSQMCSFLCHLQLRECLPQVSIALLGKEGFNNSQLKCGELLLHILGAAVEDPEKRLFVETLNLGLYRLHVRDLIALGQPVTGHHGPWRCVVEQ